MQVQYIKQDFNLLTPRQTLLLSERSSYIPNLKVILLNRLAIANVYVIITFPALKRHNIQRPHGGSPPSNVPVIASGSDIQLQFKTSGVQIEYCLE